MIEYLAKMLHCKIDYEDYQEALPLYLVDLYDIKRISLHNMSFLLLICKEDVHLAMMKKHMEQFKKLCGMHCVFGFSKLRSYKKNKMIENEISFILKDSFIYIPFLALVLAKNKITVDENISRIMPMTQKLLLCAIYEGWKFVTVKEVIEKLQSNRMTIMRVFDELEALDLQVVRTVGRTRAFVWEKGKRELWLHVKKYLHNPVIKRMKIKENHEVLENCKLSNISALSTQSLLVDNVSKTYAIYKNEFQKKKDLFYKLQIDKEEKGVFIEVYEYWLQFNDKIIDTLSVLLSLEENDIEDSRVQNIIENLLLEVLND